MKISRFNNKYSIMNRKHDQVIVELTKICNKNFNFSYYFHLIKKIVFTVLTLVIFLKTSLGQTAEAADYINDNMVSNPGFSNDPYFNTQWYIDNPGQYIDMSQGIKEEKGSIKDIDMDVIDAWKSMMNAGITDNEVIVAVIDTGVDYKHPDLTNNMWININEIPNDNMDNDNNGYIDDVNGWDFYNGDNTVCHYYSESSNSEMALQEDNDNHGTHVAGIIAAVLNNNLGIAGVASNINIKIMPLKINGGINGDGDINSAIEAVKYAQMMGADICNMSWGTLQYSAEFEQVIKESDMLFIAAAGNIGSNNDNKPVYPASYDLDNIIAVTSIDVNGKLSSYSNYGVTSVDLAAPDTDIYSTVLGGYGTMSGSSMAVPQVTAVASLLYTYKNHLYATNVKDILTSNIKKLPGLDSYMVYGGIPSAYKVVLASDQLKQDDKAPVLLIKTLYKNGKMTVSVKAEDEGASKIRVVKWLLGEKTVEDFKHGVDGTTVVDNKVNISKSGMYTFFASDYDGNEMIQTYEVSEDITPPRITIKYEVSSDNNYRNVTVIASDKQSGVKRIEYMYGDKKANEFLPIDVGNMIKLEDGRGWFKVKKDGIYTIFAIDNQGNYTVKSILINALRTTINQNYTYEIFLFGENLFTKKHQ